MEYTSGVRPYISNWKLKILNAKTEVDKKTVDQIYNKLRISLPVKPCFECYANKKRDASYNIKEW